MSWNEKLKRFRPRGAGMRWYFLLAANLAISLEIVHTKKGGGGGGKGSSGPAEGQAYTVIREETSSPRCLRKWAICWRSTKHGHPEGNGQIENLHKTLKSMLKARVEDDPQSWDEHLDYCMMTFRSSVHSSTGHTPFELLYGREMRITLDVMMGRAEVDERNYSEFVSDLQSSLETASRDVRESLRVAQRRQKDCYDKGVKLMVFQTGDLVLCYISQLKPGEVNKFHRSWRAHLR